MVILLALKLSFKQYILIFKSALDIFLSSSESILLLFILISKDVKKGNSYSEMTNSCTELF